MRSTARIVFGFLIISMSLVSGSLIGQQIGPQRPIGSMVVIFTKSEDIGENNLLDDMFASFKMRLNDVARVRAADLRSALPVVAADNQVKSLMAFPELIGRTDRLRRDIKADGLLLATIDAFEKGNKQIYISISMVFYDFRGRVSREMDAGSVSIRREQEKKDFLVSAADEMVKQIRRVVPGVGPGRTPSIQEEMVVCNKQSRLFHLPSCHHLPGDSVPHETQTRAQAVAGGYIPCLVCYPETRKGIDPQSLEAVIGSEAAGFIEYHYRHSNNPEDQARIEHVGRRILEANRFTKRQYVFTALQSEEVNSFAAPAGSIYVTTAMLNVVESDDELASVIAHEIAHVERGHGVKKYRHNRSLATLGAIASILVGRNISFVSDFVRDLVLRGYDRKDEAEADRYGYWYVRHTSYDPEASFLLFHKLEDMESGSDKNVGLFLRSHPKADDRIKAVTEYKVRLKTAQAYISGLDQVDAGLASAVRSDEMKYVDSIDALRSYVETVKSLP